MSRLFNFKHFLLLEINIPTKISGATLAMFLHKYLNPHEKWMAPRRNMTSRHYNVTSKRT